MATTGSTGLNNFLADTYVKETTLPDWYDAAQQGIVAGATQALGAAPAFQNTVGQQAINQLQNPNNAFNQAQSALSGIASGAANPWIVSSTGEVTPNVNTPMGGLFEAQRQQLNQLLPSTISPLQGANVASGNFGSLRGQTAIDKAKADAFATLAAQQMQSALQNQSVGAQAGANLGNVAQQNLSTELTAGNTQMNAPFQNLASYANLINDISVPGTVMQQNQMSPLSQIGAMANVPKVAGNLLDSLGLGSAIGSIGGGLSKWFTGLSTPGTGQMYDPVSGNVVADPSYGDISQSSVIQNPTNPYENPI